MPITNREEAKESGFAQVRAALEGFEGDVISADFDEYAPRLDDNGEPMPGKEFIEIHCTNVVPTKVSEELAMDISEWNWRTNCSDWKGSFWVEDFLDSADKNKLLIPDDLVGKRIAWRRVTREGREAKFNYTSYVIDHVVGDAGETKAKPAKATKIAKAEESSDDGAGDAVDLLEVAKDLAVGKTETQFRSALSLHPDFKGSELLTLAKVGALTDALVKEGKLELVKEGNKEVYRELE